MSHRIAIASRTVGCANAFIPTIQLLQKLNHELEIIAFEPSWRALEDDGIPYHKIATASEGIAILERIGDLDFLLCGTSEEADEDGLLWGWAEQRGIANMAILDSWANYSMRFTSSGSKQPFDLAAGSIAVPDTAARKRMIEAGCPPDRLAVTGNPAFDAWPHIGREIGEHWRTSLLRPNETRVISFVMEVLREYYGDSAAFSTYLGYTEEDALAVAMKTVARLPEHLSRSILFAVAPYPGEDPREVQTMVDSIEDTLGLPEKRMRTIVLPDHDKHALVSGSDTVMGMISTLLYEASLTNVPVISIQPDRLRANDLTDLHPAIEVATNEQSAYLAVEAALNQPRRTQECFSKIDKSATATQKLVQNVLSRIG